MSTSDRAPVIADVARAAGVSVPTVSRVLTGSAPVSEDKRERVLEVIKALDYRPSGTARALKRGHNSTIAVLAGNTARYGYATTIEGIEEAARAAGFVVVIGVVESTGAAADAVELVLTHGLAGVIVLKFDPPGVAALAALPRHLALVAVSGVRSPGIAQAVLDEEAAATALTEHLLELGHPTVHHVSVPPSRREDGRTRGWRRALRAAGSPVPPILPATWDPQSGREIGLALAGRPEVTAVFCGNDEIAMGVIRGLADSGRRVPQDVSVVGFDDHPLAALWTPSLTTARQDFAQLGRQAFAMLAPQIDGSAGRTVRLSTETPALVVRQSSGPVRAQSL